MCFYQLIREAGRALQCALAVLCCLLCGGPALIIAGIVVLAIPNTREADIQQYTAAVNAYNSTAPQSWSGTINGQSASPTSQIVPVVGNTEGVPTATSYFTSATLPFSASTTTAMINLLNVVPFTSAVTPTTTQTRSVSCTSQYCTSSCSGDSSNYFCSQSSITQACQVTYGGSAVAVSSCRGSSSCSCRVPVYLTTYCVLVRTSTFPAVSASMGCYYPFTIASQLYSTTPPSTFAVEVRALDDPLVALERITKGSRNFGITRATQVGIGIGLLVGGAALTLIVFGIIYGIVRCYLAPKGQANDAPPTNVQQPPSYPQPVQQPVQYPQPVQQPVQYPQPVAGYGQPPAYPQPTYPQPAYGQPTYGQPQPYAQAPSPYGQPPPKYGGNPSDGPQVYGQPL